jgi:hypothetical protein
MTKELKELPKVRGEKLSKILYRNNQWAVTTFGIECLDGTYAIKKDAIKTTHPNYSWQKHMSGKEWVEIGEFVDALKMAMKIHFNEDLNEEDLP